MTETYYAGAYWLGRHESAEACAQRAALFWRLLAHCDPLFSQWYEQAGSREESLRLPVRPDEAAFLRVFSRQENRGPKGALSMGVWNGEPDESSSRLSISCGSSSHRTPNSCVLKLPSKGAASTRVLSGSEGMAILRAMALAWEPEWGIMTSHAHSERVSEFGDPGTFVGWGMYFSRQRGIVPPLPAPVRVEPVEDQGTLVLLTSERFTVSNLEHVALAARVHELLMGAGLMRPLMPAP